MELKLSRSFLYTVVGIVAVLLIGSVVLAKRGGTLFTPYANVKGEDLPMVVGRPSLGGPKIPHDETVNYKEYAPEALAAALASGKATLLYFYAD